MSPPAIHTVQAHAVAHNKSSHLYRGMAWSSFHRMTSSARLLSFCLWLLNAQVLSKFFSTLLALRLPLFFSNCTRHKGNGDKIKARQ